MLHEARPAAASKDEHRYHRYSNVLLAITGKHTDAFTNPCSGADVS